jgi:hypothetical protein
VRWNWTEIVRKQFTGKYGVDLHKFNCIFRMGLAAYGIRDWSAAVDHLQRAHDEFPDNEQIATELTKAKQRLLESQTGQYDWKAISHAVEKGKMDLDVADYTGSVEVADFPGRGNLLTQRVRSITAF